MMLVLQIAGGILLAVFVIGTVATIVAALNGQNWAKDLLAATLIGIPCLYFLGGLLVLGAGQRFWSKEFGEQYGGIIIFPMMIAFGITVVISNLDNSSCRSDDSPYNGQLICAWFLAFLVSVVFLIDSLLGSGFLLSKLLLFIGSPRFQIGIRGILVLFGILLAYEALFRSADYKTNRRQLAKFLGYTILGFVGLITLAFSVGVVAMYYYSAHK
jgi:nitrate reductase gamma subunit